MTVNKLLYWYRIKVELLSAQNVLCTLFLSAAGGARLHCILWPGSFKVSAFGFYLCVELGINSENNLVINWYFRNSFNLLSVKSWVCHLTDDFIQNSLQVRNKTSKTLVNKTFYICLSKTYQYFCRHNADIITWISPNTFRFVHFKTFVYWNSAHHPKFEMKRSRCRWSKDFQFLFKVTKVWP